PFYSSGANLDDADDERLIRSLKRLLEKNLHNLEIITQFYGPERDKIIYLIAFCLTLLRHYSFHAILLGCEVKKFYHCHFHPKFPNFVLVQWRRINHGKVFFKKNTRLNH